MVCMKHGLLSTMTYYSARIVLCDYRCEKAHVDKLPLALPKAGVST